VRSGISLSEKRGYIETIIAPHENRPKRRKGAEIASDDGWIPGAQNSTEGPAT
jgi:hypothetical protein